MYNLKDIEYFSVNKKNFFCINVKENSLNPYFNERFVFFPNLKNKILIASQAELSYIFMNQQHCRFDFSFLSKNFIKKQKYELTHYDKQMLILNLRHNSIEYQESWISKSQNEEFKEINNLYTLSMSLQSNHLFEQKIIKLLVLNKALFTKRELVIIKSACENLEFYKFQASDANDEKEIYDYNLNSNFNANIRVNFNFDYSPFIVNLKKMFIFRKKIFYTKERFLSEVLISKYEIPFFNIPLNEELMIKEFNKEFQITPYYLQWLYYCSFLDILKNNVHKIKKEYQRFINIAYAFQYNCDIPYEDIFDLELLFFYMNANRIKDFPKIINKNIIVKSSNMKEILYFFGNSSSNSMSIYDEYEVPFLHSNLENLCQMAKSVTHILDVTKTYDLSFYEIFGLNIFLYKHEDSVSYIHKIPNIQNIPKELLDNASKQAKYLYFKLAK